MRVPLSWLRDHVDLPARASAQKVGAAMIRAGFELEGHDAVGADLRGPVIVGAVRDVEELTEFKKPIRFCQVDVGGDEPHGIVCGAQNFRVGDRVAVALPGAVLPGGFEIGARRTYGHVSDGMICSARELGLGEEHTGILVLPGGPAIGADAIALLELRDDVLDLAIGTDRGYAESIRGMAREVSHAFDAYYTDPTAIETPFPDEHGWPVRIEDPGGCGRFSARTITHLTPGAVSPLWLQRRLLLAGMRPISLAVDVTNYVMLETGQPMHAYDGAKLTGEIVVRRAGAGERLRTLDGAQHALDPDDIVVTDESGPIGLAGVMGGASTEISSSTVDIVLEAAYWDPGSIARAARRHRCPSEASRRFERGIDPEIARAALERAAALLVEYGGARADEGFTVVGQVPGPAPIHLALDLPGRVAGIPYTTGQVLHRLEQIGCTAATTYDAAAVTPPSWRPDLAQPADLVEEVIRLEGYEGIPSMLPSAPPGRGLTAAQRARRALGRSLAAAGHVEVLSWPFAGPDVADTMGLEPDDPVRRAVRLLNPLAETEPFLRTALLPGLLSTLRRNVGRGQRDVSLFETGRVYLAGENVPAAPRLPVERPPSAEQVGQLDAALPDQPWHVAAVFAGQRVERGWWGPGRPAEWSDAVAAAELVARALRVDITVRAGRYGPWHPGRCAAITVGGGADGPLIGYAGELHPRVITALELPSRTCAMELDLDALGRDDEPVRAPSVSAYPPALLDVALVVPEQVPAAEVTDALRAGAGELLESLALFDVYAGEQVGAGRRSLAYALRFRAPDRTLTIEESTAARDSAVAEAGRRTGATLRA